MQYFVNQLPVGELHSLVMAAEGKQKDVAVLNLKRRIKALVRLNAGSQSEFARKMTQRGYKISASLVSRWENEDSPLLPAGRDFVGIGLVEPRVSLDFLYGRKEPETHMEHLIMDESMEEPTENDCE